MNTFTEALFAQTKNESISSEYDLYGKLIGNWDILWVENEGTPNERKVKGEWLFSWILEGMAVQDLFIVPSRSERKINPQPDGEYGTTIRMYNPHTHNWDIYYGCTGSAFRLEGKKEGESIVQTEISEGKMKWIISDINGDSFKLEKIICDDRGVWNLEGLVYAKRQKMENKMNYREKAINCVKDTILPIQRAQFKECGRCLDEQYKRYGNTPWLSAKTIEAGRVYEIGYPRCLCLDVASGKAKDVSHCECSRQSVLYIIGNLLPDKKISVEIIETVLGGPTNAVSR